jgi:hypothetical protein
LKFTFKAPRPVEQAQPALRPSRATRPKSKRFAIGGAACPMGEPVPPGGNAEPDGSSQEAPEQREDLVPRDEGPGTTDIAGREDARQLIHGEESLAVCVREDQWPDSLRHGLTSPSGEVECFDPRQGVPPNCDILVEIDAALCEMEGIPFYRRPGIPGIFTQGVTAQGIVPPKYFLRAVDRRSGL